MEMEVSLIAPSSSRNCRMRFSSMARERRENTGTSSTSRAAMRPTWPSGDLLDARAVRQKYTVAHWGASDQQNSVLYKHFFMGFEEKSDLYWSPGSH
jgi:hypothetical protein